MSSQPRIIFLLALLVLLVAAAIAAARALGPDTGDASGMLRRQGTETFQDRRKGRLAEPKLVRDEIPQREELSGTPLVKAVEDSARRWSRLRLRVIDEETKRPLDRVTVFHLTRGTVLGLTGRDGRIQLRNLGLLDLVFAREGWLVASFELAGQELKVAGERLRRHREVELALVKDRFTLPLRLSFVDGAGRPGSGVRFCLQRLDGPLGSPSETSLPIPRLWFTSGPRIPDRFSRAWVTHVMHTQSRRPARTLGLDCHYPFPHYWYCGPQGRDQVYEASAEGTAELRLPVAGYYRVVALSSAGGRAAQAVRVGPTCAAEKVVHLGRSLSLWGRVRAGDSWEPVTGVEVVLTPPQLLVDPTSTDSQGRFTFGGLANKPMVPLTLTARAKGFEPMTVGPLWPGVEVSEILLQRTAMHVSGKKALPVSSSAVGGACPNQRSQD